MISLIDNGLAEDAGNGIWRITDKGRKRSKAIY